MANVMKNQENGKKGWLRRLAERRVRMWALKNNKHMVDAVDAYAFVTRGKMREWRKRMKFVENTNSIRQTQSVEFFWNWVNHSSEK